MPKSPFMKDGYSFAVKFRRLKIAFVTYAKDVVKTLSGALSRRCQGVVKALSTFSYFYF